MAHLSPSAHVDTFCRDNLPEASLWPDLRFDLPELRWPERYNCAEALLDRVVRSHGPDRPCLLTDTLTWSYGDLLRRANQVARVLTEDLGLVPGNRVLLMAPNTPWLVAAWFGTLKAGCVAVAVVPVLRRGELEPIFEIARVDAALADARVASELEPLCGDTIPLRAFGGGGADDLETLCEAKPGDFDNVPTAADDVALLAFTSGTTGRPKATMHFHRDVSAIAETFSRHVLRPRPDDLFAGSPPLAFTFGLGGLVVFPMHVGARTLLIERASPPVLLDAAVSHGASVLFTAPTAYRAMLSQGRADALAATLRRGVSAGENLPEATWRAFHDATGVRLIDGIGATELLHIFISSSDDDIRPGATGRVVPGYEAKIIDADGLDVPDGTLGRLAVRGPTGCRYLRDERQHEYVRDGWNLTGDTFVRDDDGYFWFKARSDDMIVSSGYNIAGPEVEAALLKHDAVAECGVVGVPDEARGMLVKAVVVLRPGASADDAMKQELQEFARQQIAPYKYPRLLEFADALPRSATGKLQRFRLRSGG